MISVIGIGNAASSIVENFKSQSGNYKVYQLGSEYKNTKYTKNLKHYDKPEDYEQNIPNLSKFFSDINENIQVFVVGSSYSSNYTLGVLEQLRDKTLEVFYVRPDVELLTGVPKLLENRPKLY